MERVKTEITYVKGDATEPVGDGTKIILHVCNDIGGWGAGFVMAVSKKWKEPEAAYRAKTEYVLGTFENVMVEERMFICNLIAQEGTVSRPSGSKELPPIRYVAIETGLKSLAKLVNDINNNSRIVNKLSVHMPMIGSGLAGGNWDIIEKIIQVTLCDAGIPVTVYKFD